MKRTGIISGVLVALFMVAAMDLTAQTRRNTNRQGGTSAAAQQGGAATTPSQGSNFTRPSALKKNLAPDGFINKKTISTREPIPYRYIREADVMWSKRIWRTIDMREKMNFPLYFPTEEITLRVSLAQALVRAVFDGEIRAFSPEDDEFTTLLTLEELSDNCGAVGSTQTRRKMDDSGDTTITTPGQYTWSEFRELLIKEDWFFDRHYSKVDVRIIGLCPVRVYTPTLNTAQPTEEEETDSEANKQKKQTFWVNYEEARKVLARTPAYIEGNAATPMSFDDIFNKRYFTSYVTKEENPYNNRSISMYTTDGYTALLAADAVDNEIVTFEMDLWEW